MFKQQKKIYVKLFKVKSYIKQSKLSQIIKSDSHYQNLIYFILLAQNQKQKQKQNKQEQTSFKSLYQSFTQPNTQTSQTNITHQNNNMQQMSQRQSIKQSHSQQLHLQQQYERILKQLLNDNESLKSLLSYCQNIYDSYSYSQTQNTHPIIQSFQQYSPREITKILLQPQIKTIRNYFNLFPNQKCKLQHFILILIQVMNITFQQAPKYMIGSVQIFKQINIANTISYRDFFTYVLGQISTLHEDQQNTQFQVHFEEKKKQDYLLHDNGIKRIYYASDMAVYIVLDYDSDMIKIYNLQMHIISRFQPSKQKHFNKSVKITHFDFNQFNNKLAITYNDSSIELINLYNFLNRPREQFQRLYLSYEIFYIDEVIIHIEFVQMTNKWLVITESNKLVLYDLQRPKQSKQQLTLTITLWQDPKQQQRINNILQIVPLSTICIIAGNEVFFFNQKLTNNRKYSKYKHGSNIKVMKYSEDKNSFYILGQQKVLTILTVERNSVSFKISSYPLYHMVRDFQVFAYFETILFTDNQHNVYLYDMKSLFCYQSQSYAHIAKKYTTRHIRVLKISKQQFIIYQSYMLAMVQQKVAIQKQVEYNIQPQVYYDSERQQVYISVNNQIVNFNVLRRQILKIYNSDTSTIERNYLKYVVDNYNGQIMVVTEDMRLVFVEKVEKGQNDNMFVNYNSRLVTMRRQQGGKRFQQLEQLKMIWFNYHKNIIYLLGKDQLYQVKKQNKQLIILRQMILQNIGQIISYSYSLQSNQLFITTDQNMLYLIGLQDDFTVKSKILLQFEKDSTRLQETKSIQCHYLSGYQTAIILSNNNLLYLIDLKNSDQYICIKLLQSVPYKQVDIDFKFVKMVVQNVKLDKTKDNTTIKSNNPSIKKQTNLKSEQHDIIAMLTTQHGHYLEIHLNNYLNQIQKNEQKFKESQNNQRRSNYIAIQTNKNKHLINANFIEHTTINLSHQQSYNLIKNTFLFDKRHDKQIIIMKSIYLQKNLTLTVSKDGQIKLYHHNQPKSIMRLPNLAKKYSNIEDIQKIKINKISIQIKSLLHKINSHYYVKNTPQQVLNKIKQKQHDDTDFRKINHQQPFPIEIQKPNIQEIIRKQVSYQQISTRMNRTTPILRSHRRNSSAPKLQQSNKTYSSPWRDKRSFVGLYQNLPSPDKYARKIPKELICLRKSLDMTPRQKKVDLQNLDLKILPQINSYQFQPKDISKNSQKTLETSQVLNIPNEDFQSCYYIKTARRPRKSNINDFDEIDKEFFKKQTNSVKKYLPKKQSPKKQDKYQEPNLSKSFYMKKTMKKAQLVLDYNMVHHRPNPICSILELFEKHNKQVTGSKYGRHIRINKDLKNLKNTSFQFRY